MNDKLLLQFVLMLLVAAPCSAVADALAGDSAAVEAGHTQRRWQGWGNHRAIVRVKNLEPALRARLPWRLPFRIDSLPARDGLPKNAVFVVDATTGNPVRNIMVVERNDQDGEVVFEPTTAPGNYYVYYLLVNTREFADNWQQVETGHHWQYPAWQEPEADWCRDNGVNEEGLAGVVWRKLPKADFLGFESVNDFHDFTEMEAAASDEEVTALVAEHPDEPFLVFPEDRQNPIRMKDRLPLCWVTKGPQSELCGQAQPGEFFAFQLGLFAARNRLQDIEVQCEDLRSTARNDISLSLRCFNTEGVDWQGRPIRKQVSIDRHRVQALWCGVDVPAGARHGQYNGAVTIAAEGQPSRRIAVELNIAGEPLADRGDGDLWRHARLRWLDSTIGLDDQPSKPFTPLVVDSNSIRCLGREVHLGPSGLPNQIKSHFSPSVTKLVDIPREMLASPIRMIVERHNGATGRLGRGQLEFTGQTEGNVSWQSTSSDGNLTLECQGRMEFDGFIAYRLVLSADRATQVNDIRLEIPLRRDMAKYLMGMGHRGGKRPPTVEWAWDQNRHQDAVWVGDVNAGMQCQLLGENYVRPNVNIYYQYRPLNLPPAWHNKGRGGCVIADSVSSDGGPDQVVLKAYSGPREIGADEPLHFYFNLCVTPFRTLNTDQQWKSRYWHRYTSGPDENTVPTFQTVRDVGCNIINLHGNGKQNPYINYPFITTPTIKAYVQKAHDAGMRAKIYYTVRELSNHTAELWALRSLGSEVLASRDKDRSGMSGGFSWNAEHIGLRDYHGAWVDLGSRDASHLTAGMSRWHNYYLEGLGWLIRNVGIDGIYIDDCAYDRTVIQRTRKVLDRTKPGCLIDLHSWNHFDRRAGFANCANLYMQHMPYIDKLWFGEDFHYGALPPDFWLVEISGIPFGLMGEMMSNGNPWLGMAYGMTGRMGWGEEGPGRRSPSGMWKVWDQFGIADAEMIGYWDPECPVTTDQPEVLATAYVRSDRTLVAVANFAEEHRDIHLDVNWRQLGIALQNARVRAPDIEEVQEQTEFRPGDAIPVSAKRGWLLILEAGKQN